MLKQDDVIKLHVPKYKELKVQALWNLVKDADEVFSYFPDYTDKQIPERDFLFKILSTIKTDIIRGMIKQSRDARSVVNQEDEDELILIKKDLMKEIKEVATQQSKLFCLNNQFFSHKGLRSLPT